MILLPVTTIAAAGTLISQVIDIGGKTPKLVTVTGAFLYGSGGTSVNTYLQTSFDNVSFFDVINMQFLLAAASKAWSFGPPAATQTFSLTDGALAADTGRTGLMGRFWRAKAVSVGTYGGATSLGVNLFGSN